MERQEPNFSVGELKDYTFWKTAVSFRQHTLGSYIIFAKREVEKFSDLIPEELTELIHVMKIMEQAVMHAFQMERINYLQLGNHFHNLHFHSIPRYSSPRMFDEREWKDESFGHHPRWKDNFETEETIKKIKDAILPFV